MLHRSTFSGIFVSLITVSLLLGILGFNPGSLILAQAGLPTSFLPPKATVTPPAPDGLRPLIIPDELDVIPDAYIVVYKAGINTALAVADDRARLEQLGGRVDFVYTHVLQGFAATLPSPALDVIRKNPLVDYVVADVLITLDDKEWKPADTTQSNPSWGLDRIDQRNLPLTNSYFYETTASNVHVYVIDTGIYTGHNEFSGRANKVFDAVNDSSFGNDCNGHGTHVAGTIGGTKYGVAKKVKLHAVKVLSCAGPAPTSGVIAGVDWVAANHVSPAVANMSIGGGAYEPLDTAVENLVKAGVVVVVAAGNETDYACNHSPARAPNALTVGATIKTDSRASFSNFGNCLDLFAPGYGITSAWKGGKNAINTISGTSMATPHVAGVAALFLSKNPKASPAVVMDYILDNATAGKVKSAGAGSPNLLLFSNFFLGLMPNPQLPTGLFSDRAPTYLWDKVPGATQYQFRVLKVLSGGGTVQMYAFVVPSSACNMEFCFKDTTKILGFDRFKWQVRAYKNGLWQPWTDYETFMIRTKGGFNSQFTNNSNGWKLFDANNGLGAPPWVLNAASPGTYNSASVSQRYSAIIHSGSYSTFTYSVKVRRPANNKQPWGNFISFRGAPFAYGSGWFGYSVSQYGSVAFSVGYMDGITYGGRCMLDQPYVATCWKFSSSDVFTAGWNTLTVTGNGSFFQFFVNGIKVDEVDMQAAVSGPVGVVFYGGITSNSEGGETELGETLFVDYAWLKMSAPPPPADMTASSGVILSGIPVGIGVESIYTTTFTPSPTPTLSPTPTFTPTPTPTATASESETPVQTPTEEASPTPTEEPSATPAETASETATETATSTATETPQDTATETATPLPSETPTATQTPSETPTPTPTQTPTPF